MTSILDLSRKVLFRKHVAPFAVLAMLIMADYEHAAANEPQDGPPENGVISGMTVRVLDSNGKPIGGAMFSVQVGPNRRVTRFSNSEGWVDLANLDVPGKPATLSHTGYQTKSFVSGSPGALVRLDADAEFLQKLPSSQWLELLPDGDLKREFIVNCASCHGLAFDRIMSNGRARDAGQWQAAITAMRGIDVYEVIPPDFDDDMYSRWLADHLSDEAISTLAPRVVGDADRLAEIEITEYSLPKDDSLPHDLVIGPSGQIWITAFLYDELWSLTPETSAIQRYSVDDRDDVNAQPRALEFDNSGQLWLVNGGSESVLRFNPLDGSYVELPVGMYAHSIDLAPDGSVWVNDYFAAQERLAVIDPTDNSVSVVQVPEAGRPATEGLPLPYGLQVDSRGRVYSTQLAANTLVQFDSRDRSSLLWTMPTENSGPRRPGLDQYDALWIPEFNTGHVTVFNSSDQTFDRIRFGSSSLGLYDIEINQVNDEVWATGSLDSSLIRYRPNTREILVVPLPTQPAYTRHIAVDESNGDIWTAYSSLPAAYPKVVRLRILKN